MSDLLGYRFPATGAARAARGDGARGLGGHAVGNLLLAAMTALEGGDFEEGVRRMNRVLAVRGKVVPASATPINLVARTRDGATVERAVDDHADARTSSASGSSPATSGRRRTPSRRSPRRRSSSWDRGASSRASSRCS